MVDVIIIGGGPAGATCALWLKMLGHKPCLVEKRQQIGGLQADSPYLNQWVPMLPYGTRGIDVAATMHATLEQHGIAAHVGVEAQEVARRQDNSSTQRGSSAASLKTLNAKGCYGSKAGIFSI